MVRILIIFLSSLFLIDKISAQHLWFEKFPDVNDPCTLIFVSNNHTMYHFHPATNCKKSSFLWYATFGRVHLWYHYSKSEFEICLEASTADRVYIWWDSKKGSWSPISAPIKFGEVPDKERCRRSINGTMDLYLEPPWGFAQLFSFVTWSVNFDFTDAPSLDEEED